VAVGSAEAAAALEMSKLLDSIGKRIFWFFFFFFFLNFIFCLFVFSRAALVAYGGSQVRGLIGAVAASLHHSHNNARSEPCL